MDYIIIFLAGIAAGAVNSLAGGGSAISFPALIFVGVPPIIANATNTLAASMGYISGAFGFRKAIIPYQRDLIWQVPITIIASLIGAWLLLKIGEQTFTGLVPWLMLFATTILVAEPYIQNMRQSVSPPQTLSRKIAMAALMFPVYIYGGFFNAGLGLITLASLLLLGYQDLRLVNGLKLVFASSASLTAIFYFVLHDQIDWQNGVWLMGGILIGGYAAAHIASQLPPRPLRLIIISIAIIMTGYCFYLFR